MTISVASLCHLCLPLVQRFVHSLYFEGMSLRHRRSRWQAHVMRLGWGRTYGRNLSQVRART
jgi:hypothetical protein